MKRIFVLMGSIAVVALFVVFEAVPQAEVEEAPVTWEQLALSDGGELFVELCGASHGADGKGNGPASPALAAPAPDVTQLALHNGGQFPEAAVKKAIRGEAKVAAHGSLEMPIWGRALYDARPDLKPGRRYGLAQLRIQALTAYIESIQVRE